MNNRKIALVTGASRGIGKEIAKKLVEKGYIVFGTSRNPRLLKQIDKIEGVQYLPMDLSDETSIQEVINQLEYIDVLINNAGESQMGPAEEVPMERMKSLFQISLFGHIKLIQGVLPLMRNKKSGLIVNITSFASHTPVPFSSVYASAKAAMEVFSKGLANEVYSFGIKVTSIAPTFVKTSIHQEKICNANSPYKGILNNVKAKRDANINLGIEPCEIADKVMKIIDKKNPAPFYGVGEKSFLINLMVKILPEKSLLKGIRKNFNINFIKR